jgi:hypothetical protein
MPDVLFAMIEALALADTLLLADTPTVSAPLTRCGRVY